MAKRGPKNLLDLTRESGNVRRALRSNRGLNHELKIQFQHLSSEQVINDVGWRNKERLVRRHAVQVLGPFQRVIARMRIEREQRRLMAETNSNYINNMDDEIREGRDRSTSILLPAVNRPRSSSNASSLQHHTTISSSDNPSSSPSNSFEDLSNFRSGNKKTNKPAAGRPRSPESVIGSRPPAPSIYSREVMMAVQKQRAKTSLPRDHYVATLEEKLDKFHLCLLEDSQKRVLSALAQDHQDQEHEDDGDDEVLDADRLARLRHALIDSVAGARLRMSAKLRRQQMQGVGGESWQSLAAAMRFSVRPATTKPTSQNEAQQQRQQLQQTQQQRQFGRKSEASDSALHRLTIKRPSTIMEVPSPISNRGSTVPGGLSRNATVI